MSSQHRDDRFGGRPLTQAEYNAALRIEKKRSRWFWSLMLIVMTALALGIVVCVRSACENRLETAVINETGIDHRYPEANYNNYCMIEYHNQQYGTAYDYFNRADRQSIPRELEMDMREAYYVGYLYAPVEERIDFAPRLSLAAFDQKLQAAAEAARERLEAPYERWKIISLCAAAATIAFAAAMILLATGRRRLDGVQVVCREGVAAGALFSLMNIMKMTLHITFAASDRNGGEEYTQTLKVKRWHILPGEVWLFLRMDEVPVLLVSVDGRLRYYPTQMMKT